jgi:peptidoglycan/LPS O-acetylase OafA/YrhL
MRITGKFQVANNRRRDDLRASSVDPLWHGTCSQCGKCTQENVSGTMQPQLKSRNQQLDLLRGIAILLVLGRHHDTIPFWSRIGWSGVDLFFVLSGFLISGLLFSEYKKYGQIDIKRFWIRRGFKIYPPFYGLMLFTIIYSLLRYKIVPRAVLADLFFLQNYFPPVWTHGWSLAVEEHFYLLLPLVLWLMMKLFKSSEDPFHWIPLVSIGLTVLCLFLRISVASGGGLDWNRIIFPTHLRVDALFAGVTLGYYREFQPHLFQQRHQYGLCIMGVLLLVPGLFLGNLVFLGTIGLMLTFSGFACIVAWATNRRPFTNPMAKLLAWIGNYSYSIYLWHAVPSYFLFPQLHLSLLSFAGYVFLSLALGIAMAKLLETPSLLLRDKWFPSRTTALQTETPVRVSTYLPEIPAGVPS